jgi:hypothetical protein
MDAVMDWMLTTPINTLAVGYQWSWPALEALHFLALCTLMGSLLIMDLRLIGFQRIIPLKAVHSLMPIALVSFAVNLLTGVAFLFGDPYLYAGNYAFWVKMGLIGLAGLNFLVYFIKVEPVVLRLGPHDPTPTLARAVGAMSLLFWFGVMTFGRLLPYLGPGGG